MGIEHRKIRCFCSSCQRDTNHVVLASETVCSPSEDYWWTCDYCIAKCCGCDNVSLVTATTDESVVDYEKDGVVTYPTVYKTYPYHKPFVKAISNLWPIPTNIATIYRETINALDNECFLLAAAGFRVIVEAICIDCKIEGKSLKIKINNLCKKGIITKNDRDRLHSIRFMGNDSVHSVKKPDKQQIRLVLDIIHNMLNGLYVFPDLCKDILEEPISDFDEFLQLLDEGLKKAFCRRCGHTQNLLPPSRRLINEDRSTFENQLKESISNGGYTKLALCPVPTTGKNQQYKILSI